MNDLIVIPDETIEIIISNQHDVSKPNNVSKYTHLVYLKIFLTALTYLFVTVMILWLLNVFNDRVQHILTITYIAMIVSALVGKLFMKKNHR